MTSMMKPTAPSDLSAPTAAIAVGPVDTLAHTPSQRRQLLVALAALGSAPGLWPARALAQTSVTPVYGNLRGASLGANAALNGAVPFPAGHAFNTDISTATIDPSSASIIAGIGSTISLRPDFGAGTWDGGPIGIPYIVVSGTQAKVTMRFTAYPAESDAGPYPVPPAAPIEGGSASAGDRHVIVVDRDNNRLYELYRAFPGADGSWSADCGAVFHLDSLTIRPTAKAGWTSADAAGLPILPGLVRYDEASRGAGGIRHALRFTVPKTRRAYVPPATHWASTSTSTALAPMGARFRLKSTFVIPSTFSNEAKAILTALKTYGMFVADNGSALYLSGAPDERWNNSRLITELKTVKASHFDVLTMTGLVKG
ncbi:MAG: hypothetical protein RLZZ592_2595 [Pseudomonadota bacterium]|jgi:hypothetical protein